MAGPRGVALDSQHNLYVVDTGNNRIRKISAEGMMTTLAGTGEPGSKGDGGLALAGQLNGPRGIAVDGQRNVYIADAGNNRIRDGIHKALTDNWQLTLLASTGIALSLASAYTTFDGLRNFTSAPLLSVFISFGVQGVMLIVAWLIGESFAVGMNQRTSDGRLRQPSI